MCTLQISTELVAIDEIVTSQSSSGMRLPFRTQSYKRNSGVNYAGFCYAKNWTNQRDFKSLADCSDWFNFQRSIIYAGISFIGSGPGVETWFLPYVILTQQLLSTIPYCFVQQVLLFRSSTVNSRYFMNILCLNDFHTNT